MQLFFLFRCKKTSEIKMLQELLRIDVLVSMLLGVLMICVIQWTAIVWMKMQVSLASLQYYSSVPFFSGIISG